MRNCCNEFFTALKRVEKLYLVYVEVGKRLQEKYAHDETTHEPFTISLNTTKVLRREVKQHKRQSRAASRPQSNRRE